MSFLHPTTYEPVSYVTELYFGYFRVNYCLIMGTKIFFLDFTEVKEQIKIYPCNTTGFSEEAVSVLSYLFGKENILIEYSVTHQSTSDVRVDKLLQEKKLTVPFLFSLEDFPLERELVLSTSGRYYREENEFYLSNEFINGPCALWDKKTQDGYKLFAKKYPIKKRKTLVIIDIDETLIHGQPNEFSDAEKLTGVIPVLVRRGVREFILSCKEHFDVVGIATSAQEYYAKHVLSSLGVIDLMDFISTSHQCFYNGEKNWREIVAYFQVDEKNTVIVDDKRSPYRNTQKLNKEHFINVRPFYGHDDDELVSLTKLINTTSLPWTPRKKDKAGFDFMTVSDYLDEYFKKNPSRKELKAPKSFTVTINERNELSVKKDQYSFMATTYRLVVNSKGEKSLYPNYSGLFFDNDKEKKKLELFLLKATKAEKIISYEDFKSETIDEVQYRHWLNELPFGCPLYYQYQKKVMKEF